MMRRHVEGAVAAESHPDLRLAAEARKRELLAVADLESSARKSGWWYRYTHLPWYLRALVLLATLYVLWWVGRVVFAIVIVAFK